MAFKQTRRSGSRSPSANQHPVRYYRHSSRQGNFAFGQIRDDVSGRSATGSARDIPPQGRHGDDHHHETTTITAGGRNNPQPVQPVQRYSRFSRSNDTAAQPPSRWFRRVKAWITGSTPRPAASSSSAGTVRLGHDSGGLAITSITRATRGS